MNINDLTNMKRGSNDIQKVYKGSNVIWESGDVWDGLQHYWSFDNYINTTIYDSVSDADGYSTLSSILGSPGKNGFGATFNSSKNGEILVGGRESLNKTGSFSISCWINLTELPNPTYGGCILHKGTFPYNYRIWSFDMSGNVDLEFAMGINGSFRTLRANNIALNTWVHFVGVYDSENGMRLYINGEINKTGTITGNLSPYDISPLIFGRLNGGGATYLSKCKFDEVAMFGRVLSPTDVSALYNGGTGLFYS